MEVGKGGGRRRRGVSTQIATLTHINSLIHSHSDFRFEGKMFDVYRSISVIVRFVGEFYMN